MTIRRQVLVAAAAAALLLGGPAAAQEVKVEEHVLPNGMKLLLVHRPDEPSVSAGWVAHVGSVNERPGITGISHLFEHMMFKGTTTIGTKDPQAGPRDHRRAGEACATRCAPRRRRCARPCAAARSTTSRSRRARRPRYKELEAKFDALVKEQRDLLVKNEFDRIYTKDGASGMNAFTTNDMTVYFITVPANKLELWFWMESDRLQRPRLPRVLRRARRRLRGAPAARRVDPDRQVRGGVRGDVLALDPLRLAGHRLAVRHREHHEGRRPTTTSRPTTPRTT